MKGAQSTSAVQGTCVLCGRVSVAAMIWAEHSGRRFSDDFITLQTEFKAAVVEQVTQGNPPANPS